MTFFNQIAGFITCIGEIVQTLIVELSYIWQFIFVAFCVTLCLAVLKQVGYRNGD